MTKYLSWKSDARPCKATARSLTLDSLKVRLDDKPARGYVCLPGDTRSEIDEALSLKLVDDATEFLFVEKDPDTARRIEHLYKHMDYDLYIDPVSQLKLPANKRYNCFNLDTCSMLGMEIPVTLNNLFYNSTDSVEDVASVAVNVHLTDRLKCNAMSIVDAIIDSSDYDMPYDPADVDVIGTYKANHKTTANIRRLLQSYKLACCDFISTDVSVYVYRDSIKGPPMCTVISKLVRHNDKKLADKQNRKFNEMRLVHEDQYPGSRYRRSTQLLLDGA